MADIDPKVTLLLEGDELVGWPAVDITRAVDNVASVAFSMPFDPASATHRERFRPFTFKDLTVRVDTVDIFRGTLVGVDPEVDTSKSVVSVSAYASPGVLQDCVTPTAALPVEFNGLDWIQIATPILGLYGIELDVQVDVGAKFEKVKLDVEDTIWTFLSKLAVQRGFVLSSTLDGKILCWQSTQPGNPVANLAAGQPPVTRIAASFDPQRYFSEITGFAPAKRKRRPGSRYTVANPFLASVLRPTAFTMQDVEPGDLPAAVRGALGRMFAAMASYTVDVATWRDPSGELWEPNTTIILEAPDAMVYQPYEFLIRNVDLHQDAESTTATLELVLPGAFRGETPEALPWDD